MNFLQPTIEAKLSAALGASVKFGSMKISPLSGTFVAENMVVAGESPDRPLLTIRRISAQLSVPKALLGQIAIKEMLIESPELTLNPKTRPPRPPSEPPGKFEAQSIRIDQGKISFQNGAHEITAADISAELKQQGGNIEFNATVGQFANLGQAQAFGRIATDDLAKVPDSAASADIRFAEGLHISLKSSRLADRRAEVAIDGNLDIAKLLSALPVALPLPIEFNKPIKIDLSTDITLRQSAPSA